MACLGRDSRQQPILTDGYGGLKDSCTLTADTSRSRREQTTPVESSRVWAEAGYDIIRAWPGSGGATDDKAVGG